MATREEQLELELAALRNKDSAITGDVVTPPSNGLVLIIKDEEFACRRVGTSWQMMQFAKAQQAANLTVPSRLAEDDPRRKDIEAKRNAAGMKMLATLFDTAMVLLQPHERERFSEFMDEISASEEGLKPGELEEAIGNVIASAGGEKGKAGTPTSQPSSESSPNTNQSIRVVSFDKGTDEIAEIVPS